MKPYAISSAYDELCRVKGVTFSAPELEALLRSRRLWAELVIIPQPEPCSSGDGGMASVYALSDF